MGTLGRMSMLAAILVVPGCSSKPPATNAGTLPEPELILKEPAPELGLMPGERIEEVRFRIPNLAMDGNIFYLAVNDQGKAYRGFEEDDFTEQLGRPDPSLFDDVLDAAHEVVRKVAPGRYYDGGWQMLDSDLLIRTNRRTLRYDFIDDRELPKWSGPLRRLWVAMYGMQPI